MKTKTKRNSKMTYKDDFEDLDLDNATFVDRNTILPSPEEIARSLKNARITIVIDDDTVAFFKKEAHRHNVPYQKMVRQVLRRYMEQAKRAA